MSSEEEDLPSGGFAQYVGSDEEVDISDASSEDPAAESELESDASEEADQEAVLKKSLAAVPFGSLLKAKGQLAKGGKSRRGKQKSVTTGAQETLPSTSKQPEGEESQRKRKASELESRHDKHAPTEVSSRKPVSRRREVVETVKVQRRDPRFSSLTSGPHNKDLFRKSYGFVDELKSAELSELKKTLSALKAKERTQAGPRAKSEQALSIRQERERVEMALRRAESQAAEREKRKREEAVDKEQKQKNKERIEAGLKPFYLKQSDKKQLVLQKKYEELAGAGASGQSSGSDKKKLRKAMERRRKKNAAKERKNLPFTDSRAPSAGSAPSSQPKRLRPQ